MRCNVGEYTCKGFMLKWSDYYQEWTFEPTFLGESDEAINFSTEYANDMRGFKTIKATVAFIKENYDTLIKDCKEKFEQYKKGI